MINLDETQENKDLSPGNLLLQGRLQAGLSQEQVAKELYLTVSKVKALEVDDFDRVGLDTFVRGYIRAYSNLLKLDGAKILAVYEQKLKEIKPQLMSSITSPVVATSNTKKWILLTLISIFFIGLWVFSEWFVAAPVQKNHALSASNMAAPKIDEESFSAASLAPSSAASSGYEASSVVSVGVASAVSTGTMLAFVATSVSAAPSAVVNSASAAPIGTAALKKSVVAGSSLKTSLSSSSLKSIVVKNTTGLDEINFSFRAECWLEVSDSRGDVLATELQPAGSKLSLEGKAPFDVKLGNAAAVAIQLNGKKVNVTPVVGSKVLTLKVDE
jgi:cytoskeleton protein RodZ